MTFTMCTVETNELCFSLCKAGERKDGELQRGGMICGSEGSQHCFIEFICKARWIQE